MTVRVFISYRRKDQSTLASWLHEKLAGELDSSEVFFDTKTIKPGAPFPQSIRRAIEHATVYAVLIGPRWNPARSLDDPNDWVRQEIALALSQIEGSAQRLLIPLLCEGVAMPSPDELPKCMRALTNLHAFALSGGDYGGAVRGVVERIVERLDELDTTPPEEKWVAEKIAAYLHSFERARLAQIGSTLRRGFKQVTGAPESPRALAKAIYRVGPEALEYLGILGTPPEHMESLLELLATNWIKPEEAARLRRSFSDAQEGRRVAIECEYPDFTPDETLLKASRTEHGWASLTVKPSDGRQEIIQQIHEELLSILGLRLTSHRGANDTRSAVSVDTERAKIMEMLEKRRAEEGGNRLPFVLHATPQMAKDPKLIDRVQQAFPPLHILVATHDADELRGRIGGLSEDVIVPSDNEDEERRAYDAYADAHEMIVRSTRKRR